MMMRLKFSQTVSCICFLSVMLLSLTAFANESSQFFNARITTPQSVDDPVILVLTNQTKETDLNDTSFFQVFVGGGKNCCANKSPIIGDYEMTYNKQTGKQSISFIPRFGFVENQSYVVSLKQQHKDNSEFDQKIDFVIKAAQPTVEPIVTSVYPSGEALPENILRFYIHFSRPMKPHMAMKHIKLVDASGQVDDAAFMRFKQELWSADRKRLTVLMDPGRIKRGVETNMALGPALQEGKQYQLIIDGHWPAANGKDSLKPFTKKFRVKAPLRKLPDVNAWVINNPIVGTKEKLEIIFDRPFDHALLFKDIEVLTADGKRIPGKISLNLNETVWQFSPEENWYGKMIYMTIDSELEDVAGNNFRDLLDHTIETGTKAIKQISIPIDLQSSQSITQPRI